LFLYVFGIWHRNCIILGKRDFFRRMKKMRKNNGFTLLELMVVICILAVLATFTTPNIISWLEGRRLSQASRDVFAAVQAARLRAVKERANAVVRFNTANNTFVAFVDDGGGVPANAGNNIQDAGETVFKSGTFSTVSITGANFGGNAFVSFTTRGFPGSNGTISLQDDHGSQKQIIVSSTGSAEIRHL
jgi:prepilin-type N-terminal cleavage/methylation domain-containing protein